MNLDRQALTGTQAHRGCREIGERLDPRGLQGPLDLPDLLEPQGHLVLAARMELMASQGLQDQMECEEKL